jgi:hypothetical protein
VEPNHTTARKLGPLQIIQSSLVPTVFAKFLNLTLRGVCLIRNVCLTKPASFDVKSFFFCTKKLKSQNLSFFEHNIENLYMYC